MEDLFRGRSQLLIYHFMFGPYYTAGCPACSAIADGFEGSVVHLANHDVTLSAVSRAACEVAGIQAPNGGTFPWASAYGSDFNFDFGVGFNPEQQREGAIEYNFRREPALNANDANAPSDGTTDGTALFAAMSGTDTATYARERPGMSAFVLQDGAIHHTYSAFARGLDILWGMYQWLDRALGT